MRRLITIIIICLVPMMLSAAVSISGVTGTLTHGETITIAGSGFGTKSTAAPAVWDNCSGTNILTLWTNYMMGATGWGGSGAKPELELAYRTPTELGRGVDLPHSHITKYLCGSHYWLQVGDGSNIQIWKTKTLSSYSVPIYTYVSWYRRLDPNWVWSIDNNFKDMEWTSTMDSTPSSGNYDFISHYEANNPSYNGVYRVHAAPTSPVGTPVEGATLKNGWVKCEWETKWSQGSDGYTKVWEDGVLKTHEAGVTWADSGPQLLAIEGFYRNANDNNFRYMADIYMDWSAQRVMIGNANTLAGCTTLRAIQIPSVWSDTSITATVNQDAFADSATAYLYVFDATGASNTNGYEITFGATPASQPQLSNGTFVGPGAGIHP